MLSPMTILKAEFIFLAIIIFYSLYAVYIKRHTFHSDIIIYINQLKKEEIEPVQNSKKEDL